MLGQEKKWVTTNIGYIVFVAYQHDIMFIMQPKLEGYEAIQKPHILSNRWFMSHKHGVGFLPKSPKHVRLEGVVVYT